MTVEQTIVFAVLFAALVLFVTERWRYDVVALLALLAVAITGIVPGGQAFAGFGHPAVVTVAAVLVASRGLFNSGLVGGVASWMGKLGDSPTVLILALTALVTVCSAFMNNVGAPALKDKGDQKSENPTSVSQTVLLNTDFTLKHILFSARHFVFIDENKFITNPVPKSIGWLRFFKPSGNRRFCQPIFFWPCKNFQ